MQKYRITKYDPQYRNKEGIYIRSDWTSCCDVGKIYNEKLFTIEEYIRVEELYCKAVLTILNSKMVKMVSLKNLELYASVDEIREDLQEEGLQLTADEERIIYSLKNDITIYVEDLEPYLKLILRECFWCQFVDTASSIQIETGYDYYMYIWCRDSISEKIIEAYRQKNIFIERMDF